MAKRRKPPKSTKADVGHKIVKAGLSAIPIVGGPAAELFASLVLPPLERRRQEWMEEIGEELGKLQEERKIDFEVLRNDEEFVDTILQATQVALRNHQQEKRDALRNAVLNTAVGNTPGESLRQMFLSNVDDFTEWHLRILVLFHNPSAWFKSQNREPPNLYAGGLSSVLENAFPAMRNARPIYDQIWADLHSRGLVNTGDLHVTMTGAGLLQRRTSDLGARFVAFIREQQ